MEAIWPKVTGDSGDDGSTIPTPTPAGGTGQYGTPGSGSTGGSAGGGVVEPPVVEGLPELPANTTSTPQQDSESGIDLATIASVAGSLGIGMEDIISIFTGGGAQEVAGAVGSNFAAGGGNTALGEIIGGTGAANTSGGVTGATSGGGGAIATGAAGAAGGYLGTKIGQDVFGKEGSGIATAAGTYIGSYWGPWGAAAGGFVGGLVDSAFGGGDTLDMNSGFATTKPGADAAGEVQLVSGLTLYGIARDAGSEGTTGYMDMAQGIDKQLVEMAKGLGVDIVLSNEGFGGIVEGDGKDLMNNPTFFGSAQKAHGTAEDLKRDLNTGADKFVQAWFDAAADQFPPELQGFVSNLSGSAEEMIQDFTLIVAAGQEGGESLTLLADHFRRKAGVLDRTNSLASTR